MEPNNVDEKDSAGSEEDVVKDVALPEEEQTVEAVVEEPAAENESDVQALPPKKNKSLKILRLIFSLLLFFAAVAAIAFVVWRSQQISSAQNARIEALTQQIYALDTRASELRDSNKQTESALRGKVVTLSQRLTSAEDRLKAHNRRIISMSTTDRDDWLLAEAEYLLKLANQRVLIEKSPGSAIALLEEADAILRDLADPDLFSLRQAIQKDLVALKLVAKVDAEGIYLQLSALAEQAESIAILPDTFASADYAEGDLLLEEETSESTASNARNSFNRFFSSFKSYFRIIENSEKPQALLPPEETAYLQLNLRMQIERAQLALLREQQNIYVDSLVKAETWVARYFPRSSSSMLFRQELNNLSKKNILRQLPDISTSLELLKEYISTRHQLGNTHNRIEDVSQ